MDHDSQQIDARPRLSAALLCPLTILGIVLMGLTALPMSSCDDRSENFVPGRLVLEFAGFGQSAPPPIHERVLRFCGSVPLLFVFTWPYWTSVPVVITFFVLLASRRWGTFLWRLLTLLLSAAMASFMLFAEQPLRLIVGFGGAVALLVWIRSSPLMVRIGQKLVSVWTRRRIEKPWTAKNPIGGGFLGLAILCLTALVHLAWIRPSLLIGGKLAAVTNLVMMVVALVSARQALTDCDRIPRFAIRDLLLISMILAISFWWFWN